MATVRADVPDIIVDNELFSGKAEAGIRNVGNLKANYVEATFEHILRRRFRNVTRSSFDLFKRKATSG